MNYFIFLLLKGYKVDQVLFQGRAITAHSPDDVSVMIGLIPEWAVRA